MSNGLRFVLLVAAVISWAALSGVVGADEPSKDANASSVDAENAKQSVLAWIDNYRKNQVLFHDDDIATLRKELADDTPEEAMRWWKKSAEVRAALESPEWKETREWLREFLEVQAIYSDKQVAEFQTKAEEAAKQETPEAFKKILADVEKKRAKLKGESANAKALREDKLKVVHAFRKEDAAARSAADNARNSAGGFDTVNTGRTTTRAPRYSRPPLVDSLDAARWNVMRGFYRY